MKTAEEVAAGLVALCGRHPVGLLAEVAHALDEHARAFHEARLREALGAEAPVGDDHLGRVRRWLAPGLRHAGLDADDGRELLALVDHYRDLACAQRADNGFRDGWEAGLAEGLRRGGVTDESG